MKKTIKKTITKEVSINIEYTFDNDYIYCKNRPSFHTVWGANSNPSDINIQYVDDNYEIPIEKLEKRKQDLKNKIERLSLSLKIVSAILEDVEKLHTKKNKMSRKCSNCGENIIGLIVLSPSLNPKKQHMCERCARAEVNKKEVKKDVRY